MHQRAEAWPDLEILRDWPATPVLLLAVGPLAQRAGWAADVAIAIAEDLATHGDRIVLVDLSLDAPVLHERLGIDATEGLSDVFLFGASREHVTRMLPVHSFELIPASAFTPAVEEILTHRRWSVLFEECAASQTRLLLYLPVDLPGAKALSDRVGETVLLADEWEQESSRNELSQDAHLLATFSPPHPDEPDDAVTEASTPEPAVAVSTPEPAPAVDRLSDAEFEKIRVPKDGAREALIADLRARQRAALMAPAPTFEPSGEADVERARPAPPLKVVSSFPPPKSTGIHEPTFASRVREKPPQPSKVVPLLIVLLLVSSAAAGWHYWGRWGATGATGAMEAVGAPDTSAQSAQGAQSAQRAEAAQPLPYSVAVATYQVLQLAQERVEELGDEQANFYIAPAVVQGSLFYRVLAGPLPDSASAVAVRDTLIARRIKTISSASDIVFAPFAFLLGTYEQRSDAQARAADVAIMNIPSYIVLTSAADGTARYAVYAGAYTGRGDAEFMRGILQGASLPDTLVERTGSIRS